MKDNQNAKNISKECLMKSLLKRMIKHDKNKISIMNKYYEIPIKMFGTLYVL